MTAKYKLSSTVNPNKVFLIKSSKLEGRLDPLYYASNIFGFLKTIKYEIKPIREVIKYTIAGFGVGREEQDLTESGYIQIRPTNLDELGNLKFDKNIFLDESYIESKKNNVIQKNDILFNNTNSQELVGKTAFFDLDGIYFHSNHITRIKVDEKNIRPKYLWILLNLYQERKIFYTLCTNWNNQSGVGIELLNSIKIIVPSLKIQDKVIEIKEKSIEQKRCNEAQAEKLLASIDDYLLKELGITLPKQSENTLKSRMFVTSLKKISGDRFDPYHHQRKFSDTIKSIHKGKYKTETLKNLITDLKNGVEIRDYIDEGGIRYLRVTDLGKTGINHNSPRFILKQEIPEKIKLNANCILISRSGSLGLVNVVEPEIENSILSSPIFKVELKTDLILPHYLEAYLRSHVGQSEIFRNNNGGVIPEINQEALKSIYIPLPPLSKQKEIADHITRIRQEAQKLKEKTKEAMEKASREIEKILLG